MSNLCNRTVCKMSQFPHNRVTVPGKDYKMDNPNKPAPEEGMVWICTPYITTRNGVRVYASQHGKKAFCFWAKPRKK